MKKTPYIFITVLIVILFSLVGFRFGQNVEKTNEVINYFLSITPTKKPPTPTPIKYSEFKSKKWGLKFIYPDNLSIKESTNASEVFFEIKENKNK
ncbi:MAG: hypothetical protein US40_C0013G0012 [Candidatus Roizmanbacteria bacterium GW2011_GWC2_37_13]|uniref:Uncharacterized protein n=1 Tax=Candidatus Roizmanbacteria bacterium GW2011_GWC2_37_13 TaxID=1618486 RepID=A0A0G0GFQ8_9BACT|nr:MAG: hypothetical protein US38_C0014G0014 [Candidatus Roizmanbacteria bacterium GW2011_GWC1_37_12]KKQ24880.1 MAG: hypothetical protein US40_C0013G0012 [Candidatus Roizmanbacteria bacterium GW2011_GWC2_37_13]